MCVFPNKKHKTPTKFFLHLFRFMTVDFKLNFKMRCLNRREKIHNCCIYTVDNMYEYVCV